MKIYKYTDNDYASVVSALVNRADVDFMSHDETVRDILQAVRAKGDSAVLEYTHRFDRHKLPLEQLCVTPDEISQAYKKVKPEQIDALKLAAENIRKFHQRQVQESWEYRQDEILLGQMIRPLEIVGIYVPGGKASYPSSVLMNAIPAKVAGVEKIVMCSPAPDGEFSPHVLVAADIAGVTEIFKIGGAQAVAAMAFG
ncbi:Histidinol dehydrogenase, partial [hydrothermal vent metagenome]